MEIVDEPAINPRPFVIALPPAIGTRHVQRRTFAEADDAAADRLAHHLAYLQAHAADLGKISPQFAALRLPGEAIGGQGNAVVAQLQDEALCALDGEKIELLGRGDVRFRHAL